MEFLPLSRRRSSSRNVRNGEERGETDVLAGYQNHGLQKNKREMKVLSLPCNRQDLYATKMIN